MTDEALRTLAVDAGFQPRWTDNTGAERYVSVETLRAALAALGLPAWTEGEIADSRARLARERETSRLPPLVVARAGEPLQLGATARDGGVARVEFETGGAVEFVLGEPARLPALRRLGYHRLCLAGRELTLAVAPPAARGLVDAVGGRRLWGLAAQIYGLRSADDGGLGHFGAVADLAESAARRGADLIALSPAHALFLADPSHYTPYSPSSRLFCNALYADPALVFGAARVAEISAPLGAAPPDGNLIDWPPASQARVRLLRALHDDFCAKDLVADSALARDFGVFRTQGGEALQAHAVFEALHAREFGRDFTRWNWRDWPSELRGPDAPAVARFADEHARDVAFHVFAQWLVDRSMARAQGRALAAGMKIGLVSDLAVGMNAGGSHAWSRPNDVLLGLSIGAPPDMLAPLGQNWGLTTFSPRALRASGYAPFLATLRAALRNAGGVRVDHVMGLVRLWLAPDGAAATEGVYLTYPTDDLLGLVRLESQRHSAVIVGEDLGTVPFGLRGRLAAENIAGMRVLQFERDHERFHPPSWYAPGAVAMTGTHDTATFSGWWRGRDIEARAALGHMPPGRSREDCASERGRERGMMWRAFAEAGAAEGDAPPPDAPAAALDAATRFLSLTPSALALLPLEDALGLDDQPNLPGTTTEYPNWRRRYPAEASVALDRDEVAARLAALDARRQGGSA